MKKLADIASFAVKKTGIFHNAPTRQRSGPSSNNGNLFYISIYKGKLTFLVWEILCSS
jgi:hypothetical protein